MSTRQHNIKSNQGNQCPVQRADYASNPCSVASKSTAFSKAISHAGTGLPIRRIVRRAAVLMVTITLTTLAGCANSPLHKRSDTVSGMMDTSHAAQSAVEEGPIEIKNNAVAHVLKPQIEKGSGKFVNERAASAPVPTRKIAEGQITFNFENQPIQAVVQAILGSLLQENYTIAPNVTGNVTFSTAKPITPAQAMPILQMLLGWTHNALVYKRGRYEVVPIKDAIPGNLTPRLAPPQIAKGYEVRVFPLKYISAKQMQKLLKPYAKPDAVVSADDDRSMIIMAGTASELANYERTIKIFDVNWLKGMSIGVYSLRNQDVSKIMPDLDKVFGASGNSPLAGMFRFIPMETTNSIVVITPQPEYLKTAETWIHRLDAGVGENGTQLYVYDVKNVKATDLSSHLNAIFTGRVTEQRSNEGNVAPGMRAVSIGQFNRGGAGGGLSNRTNQRNSRTAISRENRSNLSTTGTGGTTASTGSKQTDIRITPIEENNQLLVMATPGEWDSITAAIHRLDIPPLQVQIEAKILEVTLSGNLQYGVQWYLAGLIGTATGSAQANGQYGPGFTGNPTDRHRFSLGATGSVAPTTNGGLFWSFLNKNQEVAISALQTKGQTKVLSSPSLVVMNNQEAQITVGDQVPVISTSIIGVGSLNNVTGTTGGTYTNTGIGQASYISTGVTLDITPRVNPGGLVYMDVNQEDSSPGPPAGNNPNPPISQRNLSTQVAVQSGQTVLLGGMIKENEIDSRTGVPLLSDIPLIGNLFGSTNKTRNRTELIVLITPRVINNSDEARDMTREYESKFESLAPLYAKPAQEPPGSSKSEPGQHNPHEDNNSGKQ